ncbi:MAG: hypothetical protein WC107_03840 [Patescibacteria group bacterium]
MLDKSDIKIIKTLLAEQKDGIIEEVKDIVDFAIEKSESKMNDRFDKVDQRFDQVDVRLDKMDQSISDLAETDQYILDHLNKHEKK